MSLPWFRLYHEFAGDPIVQTMSEAMQRRLIMVFCLKASGTLEKLDDEELAKAMAITPEELARTKIAFVRKGFVGQDWEPVNWEKRQTRDHGAAARMRKLREHDRNGIVTENEQQAQHPPGGVRGGSNSVSDSQEGDARGNQSAVPRRKRVVRLEDFSLPDWVPENDWNDWLLMRKAKKAPATAGAMNQAVRELEKLRSEGQSPAGVLQQSTLRAWTGLFPVNTPYTNGTPPAPPKPKRTPEEQERLDAIAARSCR